MKVVLPDSSELELPEGATGLEAARAIGPKVAELVRVNGSSRDFTISRHFEPVATVSPGTCLRIQTELNIGGMSCTALTTSSTQGWCSSQLWPSAPKNWPPTGEQCEHRMASWGSRGLDTLVCARRETVRNRL